MSMNQMRERFSGKQAAVVGAGRSGLAAARLLIALGARVRLLDTRSNVGEDAAVVQLMSEAAPGSVRILAGPHTPAMFTGVDLVVPSPGVRIADLAPLFGEPAPLVLSEIELAARCLEAPILAITGTSGKTTTATLAAAMLQAAGKNVFLGGNIGTPLSEFLLSGQELDVAVLEVSSFQLQTCSAFAPRVGVLLNVTPNHLDYHADMNEYVAAKLTLFRCQGPDDLALIYQETYDALTARGLLKDVRARIETFGPTERFHSSQLTGAHSQANIEAAYQATREFGVAEEDAAKAVARFRPLEHRQERVGSAGEILFVNDSKATTPDALRVALAGFPAPVYLLAGGKFKGGDLRALAPLVQGKVAALCLYGASREVFESAFGDVVPTTWDATLEEAMLRAHGLARRDGAATILLSPATSSYDQYSNYEARGKDFKRVAKILIQEAEAKEHQA